MSADAAAKIVHAALMAGAALALAGCGIADSRSPVPEFMRAKASEPPPPEPPPDVGRLVREQLDPVFISHVIPAQVQVSPPQHEPQGSGWTACVKAELTLPWVNPWAPDLSRHDQRRRDRRPPARRGYDNCASDYRPIERREPLGRPSPRPPSRHRTGFQNFSPRAIQRRLTSGIGAAGLDRGRPRLNEIRAKNDQIGVGYG